MEKWTELAQSGEDGIYIAFSSALSGTHDTAVMIKDQVKETNPNLDLVIIDSKCASLGYGLLVKEAARLRDAGEDIPSLKRKSDLWQSIWSIYSQLRTLIIWRAVGVFQKRARLLADC